MDNTSIIPYIIAGILAVAGAYFLFKKDKKDKKKVMMILGVVLLAGAAFAGAWQYGLLASYGIIPIGKIAIPYTNYSLTAVPTGGAGLTTGACLSSDKTTVTWSWVNKYTNVAGGGTHAYRVSQDKGVTFEPSKTISNAGTDTLAPGNVVQTLFGNETDGTYFGVVTTETIPCTGAWILSAKAVANGTLTMNSYTEGGDMTSDGTNNETIGAGDAVNLKFEVQGPNKAGFSYGGVLIVEMNGTEYDEEDTVITFSDLSVRKLTTVPNVYSVAATDHKAVAFEVGAIEGTTLHVGSLYLKADDSKNPAASNTLTIEFRPYDYFINEDNGGTFEGPAVEDEKNTATFGHITTEVIGVA